MYVDQDKKKILMHLDLSYAKFNKKESEEIATLIL